MACFRLDLGSQVFSDDGYSFHVVRYFRRPGGPLWEMMVSTSYPIRSRGGGTKFGPCVAVSLNGDRSEAWKIS